MRRMVFDRAKAELAIEDKGKTYKDRQKVIRRFWQSDKGKEFLARERKSKFPIGPLFGKRVYEESLMSDEERQEHEENIRIDEFEKEHRRMHPIDFDGLGETSKTIKYTLISGGLIALVALAVWQYKRKGYFLFQA